MKRLWILIPALLVFITADLAAQRGGGRGGRGGGGSGGTGGSGKNERTESESRPTKQSGDLEAASITAKWKDAATLEITAVVKNASKEPYSGECKVVLKVTGKDKKTETLTEETIIGIDGNDTHSIVFETTDKKHFDKDLKWTLEISSGDKSAGNDKKTTKVDPGPQPKKKE